MKYILFWIAEKYTSCTIVIASHFFETTYTILSVDIGLLSLASKDIMQMDENEVVCASISLRTSTPYILKKKFFILVNLPPKS